MPKPQTQNPKISAATLRIAASKGWDGVTLKAVAIDAKIPLKTVAKRFSTESDLIPVIIDVIAHQAQKSAGKTSGSPRDVLFALIMARFDILQHHRKAVLSIADAATKDHALACVLARAISESMAEVAETAKLRAPRLLAAAGLSAIYGWAFLAWRNDKTRDMAKTMAALDKGLRLAEKAAEILKQSF
jgi:ubiquinone biosynthesis protein COQ9